MNKTMNKHFYTHLISLDLVNRELLSLTISEDERVELISIIHSSLHYTIINLVLSHLETKDKKTFLAQAAKNDHTKTWTFLKAKTEHMEEEIIKAVKNLEKEFLQDIEELRKEKSLK